MPEPWRPPAEIEEFRLLRPLGEGAAGRVYLAHDRLLDRSVALKFAIDLAGDAREGFLAEARAAARIQHPNVAAMYRAGEQNGCSFLVTEYVRGRSLAELRAPIPWREALELGIGLARGLAAAHRHGVLHRDIKLANAIIGDQGEVKLIDFGLAMLEPREQVIASPPPDLAAESFPGTAGEEVIVGTPNYMAPELWRGEPASRRSDVYALGVLLYILCCGRPPMMARDSSMLAVRSQYVDPAPVRVRVPEIDPRFAEVIDRCIRRAPADRFASGEAVRVALERLASDERDAAVPEGNPYRGLQAFEAEHRGLFFGRNVEISRIVDRLREGSFVLVAGDSGVGKSSLCRAGVLPAIADGALKSSRAWSSVSLSPGRRPVLAIVEALARVLGLPEEELLTRVLSESLGGLLRRDPGGRGHVVFIDQLEELVTLASAEEAALAGRLLATVAGGSAGLRLLATARGDFLTRLAQLPGLGEEIGRALQFIGPLTEDGLRLAIVGPAGVKHVRFESTALVDRLVAAGRAGSLPLLQFALAELWEARDPATAVITSAALERLGGVSGALARHADGVLAGLSVAQRRAARAVLLRLVTLDATRASLTRAELVGEEPAAKGAVEALVKARLLVLRELGDGFVYEIAHEALIQGWSTLQMWLEEEGESRERLRRLEMAATEWDRLGRPREGHWSERQLAELGPHERSALRPREADFVAASDAQCRRRRRVRLAALLSVPVAVVLAAVAIRLARLSEVALEVDGYLARAEALRERARGIEAAAEERRRAAYGAFDAREREGAEAAWREAQAAERSLGAAYSEATHALEVALSIDPGRRDVQDALGDVLLARALAAERTGDAGSAGELRQRLGLHDEDGSRRARWDAPARLALATSPGGARVRIERYERGEAGALVRVDLGEVGVTPIAGLELPAGSYRVHLAAPGRAAIADSLVLRRGEALAIDVPLVAAAEVPAGFVAIPAGRFLFGSAGDEELRRGFYGTVPLHEVSTGPYLVAARETTYAEWIEFLDGLPQELQAGRLPGRGGSAMQAAPTLTKRDGRWHLRVQVGGAARELAPGAPWVRPRRALRSAQDWLRMPVSGVDWEDGLHYMQWLDRTGRVPRARYCTEIEWERAARGADGRAFPTGDVIDAKAANIDETYGREPESMGPDEVGSFPGSVSPFGLHDAAGNVYEWTEGVLAPDERVVRGGAYFFGSLSARAMNRNVVAPEFRDATVGIRVCADMGPRPPRDTGLLLSGGGKSRQ